MKLTKKKVFVVALAICLVATISMGTLAWFNATDSVTNKFEVLDSLTDFDVDVWEKVPDGDDADTEPDEFGRGETGATSHVYNDVVPGGEYLKEVYVENTSNSPLAGQYIKMEVTFTNYSVVNAMGTGAGPLDCTTMLLGANFSDDRDYATADWYYAKDETVYDENNNTVTYVFYLKNVLGQGESSLLFSKVKIPVTMDINDADNLKADGFQIKAVAYAIQNANISDPSKPNGTVLDHAMYAFDVAWAEKESKPAAPAYPTIPTNP